MRIITLLILAALAALAATANADDWPQWRGPTHNGVTTESANHPAGWPPQRLWSKRIGPGCTSPIIVAGKLYVTAWDGPADYRRNPAGSDSLYGFDAASGRQLWRVNYPSRYQGRHRTGDERMYGGPSATPTFDTATNHIYTLGVDGELTCFDVAAEGQRVWSINLYDQYQSPQRPRASAGHRDFGFTAAPLLHGDQLIVQVGAPGATVVSLDKRTGKQRWRSQYDKPPGHTAGFAPLRIQNRDAFAALMLLDVIIFDDRGRTIATQPWVTDFATNIPTPVAANNRIAVTTGYNMRRMTLFNLDGAALQPQWTARQHAVVGSPVIHDNRVFTISNALEATNLDDGNRIFRGGRFEHGSLIVTGDDRIIAFGRGDVALIDATADNYRELSRLDNVVPGTCYPHPALSDGLLAVKDKDGALVCLSIRPGETQPAPPPVKGNVVWEWPSDVRLKPRGKAQVDNNIMRLDGGALIAENASDALLEACRATNQLTLAVRFTSTSLDQRGPARIASFSADPYQRNFTLGQEGNQLILRLRTTGTDDNGMNPQTTLARIDAGREYNLTLTYAPGRLHCVLDGKVVCDTDSVTGDFSNWSPQHLLFGDEYEGSRPWRGTIRNVTIRNDVAVAPSLHRR